MDGVLRRLARGSFDRATRAVYERRFDVQTVDSLLDEPYADHLASQGLDPEGCLGYLPSDWLTLPRVFDRGEITPDDVFLDAGCGEGRMLVEAAGRYPFKRVIGVELSEPFADVAAENVRRASTKLRAPVEIVRSNVVDYEIPTDVTIAYAANPFRGNVFQGFLDRLVESLDERPRRMRFVYVGPREEQAVLATGRFRRVRYGRSFVTRAQRHRHIVLYEAG